MKYFDEDLHDIERGEPWGVNFSDWLGVLLLLAAVVVWIARHIS
jgi:hypothetical protein